MLKSGFGYLRLKQVPGATLQKNKIIAASLRTTLCLGCILINVGDLLENLTAGQYPATRHRVKIPQVHHKKREEKKGCFSLISTGENINPSSLNQIRKTESELFLAMTKPTKKKFIERSLF